MRSSLLIDLQAGKRIEVEALQGTVVRRGAALGIPTPIVSALYPFSSCTREVNAPLYEWRPFKWTESAAKRPGRPRKPLPRDISTV